MLVRGRYTENYANRLLSRMTSFPRHLACEASVCHTGAIPAH